MRMKATLLVRCRESKMDGESAQAIAPMRRPVATALSPMFSRSAHPAARSFAEVGLTVTFGCFSAGTGHIHGYCCSNGRGGFNVCSTASMDVLILACLSFVPLAKVYT